MTALTVREALQSKKDPEQAFQLQRFFKTGPGEYGEGDIFWGLRMGETRAIAMQFKQLPLEEVELLLIDPVHECRMVAGVILVTQFKKAKVEQRQRIYEFYLAHAACFNNWDLVDLTCNHIVGGWLHDKDRKPLYDLAKNGMLWEQRIAMVSTLEFIRKDDLNDTYGVAKVLLHHKHDLIQKAVGWMLRETGKRNFLALNEFLLEGDRYKTMPRTALRYAIERFPENQRQAYLKGTI